jgi:CheY-like chemotaxis protein
MTHDFTEAQWVSQFALELTRRHPLSVGSSLEVALREYLRHPALDPVRAAAIFALANPSSSSARLRALVVDDIRPVADALVLLLDAEGIEGLAAYGGQHALTLMPSYLPDVVLLDLQMPDIDGKTVAETIAQLPPERRPAVIVHTNLDLDSPRLHNLQYDRLLSKSSEIDQLARTLFQVAAEVRARRAASSWRPP